MKDRFKHAEDEYVRLKELNASGQLTQEQFDVLLKKLMVQDAQGRWLMIGADSGKWYVQEGGQWVEADTSATQLTTPMRPSSKLPVIVIGALAFVLLALGGIFVAASQGLVNIGGISKAPTFVAVITITPAATATALPTAAASLPTSPAASPTVMQMAGMDNSTPAGTLQSGIASQSVGLLRFADATGIADQVVLSLAKIPPPASGNRYEAWLVGEQGEARLSLGKVNIDAKGSGQLTFVDKDGQNLLARFDRFELTLEPEPDPSPLPSGIVLYSSAVPPGALMHIQHLLVAFDDTPDHIGLDVGLLKDAKLVNNTARDMLDAHQKSDFERVLIDAEILVNVVEGKQGEHYGDLDHNSTISDPSDGYGLLLNGKNNGYIEGAIDHAGLAAASPDATEEIKMHAEHVKIAAKNLDDWATQLRTLGLQILASKDNAAAEQAVRNAVAFGERFLNGIDLDGDETVDPVPGEAGAVIAYEHAFYMADMTILPGPNAMPTPGPK